LQDFLENPATLRNPGNHRRRRWAEAQRADRFARLDHHASELAQIVREGPDPAVDGVVRWRRVDLQRKIEARFGVRMHERTVGKQLAALGFRRLSVRPQHPKSDPGAQAAFKKTSPRP
jgi:transposase